MEYEEVVDYGINEKEIKKTRFYHEGNRIDSTVTSSLNDSEIEITYLKGIQTEKIIRSFGKFKTIEKYYEGNSEKPFLIWYTYYDTKRRIIKRTQEFLNHKETTEYISKFGDKDKPDIEELLINGKIKSTTTNYKDKKGNYIKTHYKENEYETITCRTFNLQHLEIKSIIETIENGVKTEAESWIHKYEFY